MITYQIKPLYVFALNRKFFNGIQLYQCRKDTIYLFGRRNAILRFQRLLRSYYATHTFLQPAVLHGVMVDFNVQPIHLKSHIYLAFKK